MVAAVRIELPGRRVGQLGFEHGIQPAAAGGVAHRCDDLDPAAQVARAPVGGADVVLGVAAVGEVVDAGVLEEPPHDADDADPRGQAGGGSSDRKSTRLNSSHTVISYAVFCLKKKN